MNAGRGGGRGDGGAGGAGLVMVVLIVVLVSDILNPSVTDSWVYFSVGWEPILKSRNHQIAEVPPAGSVPRAPSFLY